MSEALIIGLRSTPLYIQVSEAEISGRRLALIYIQVSEAVISGLRPALLYQVRVFAENELGRSKEGRVLQVR